MPNPLDRLKRTADAVKPAAPDATAQPAAQKLKARGGTGTTALCLSTLDMLQGDGQAAVAEPMSTPICFPSRGYERAQPACQ